MERSTNLRVLSTSRRTSRARTWIIWVLLIRLLSIGRVEHCGKVLIFYGWWQWNYEVMNPNAHFEVKEHNVMYTFNNFCCWHFPLFFSLTRLWCLHCDTWPDSQVSVECRESRRCFNSWGKRTFLPRSWCGWDNVSKWWKIKEMRGLVREKKSGERKQMGKLTHYYMPLQWNPFFQDLLQCVWGKIVSWFSLQLEVFVRS